MPRLLRLVTPIAGTVILATALAIRTVADGAVEQYSGTALYASMVYVTAVFLWPRLTPPAACGITIALCWAVETFQLTGIPAFLSAHSLAARLVLGVQFDMTDILWYPVGVIPLAALHWMALRQTRR
jgi:Protein of unknown function (DUF2809)